MEAVYEKEQIADKYKSAITPELVEKAYLQVKNKSFDNLSAANQPVIKIISGPCGMGKTTMTNLYMEQNHNYVWLNSDSFRYVLDETIFSGEISRKHPDLLSGIFSDLARDLRERLGKEALNQNFNIILDCTLIKKEICQNLLTPALNQGYQISPLFLTGDILTSLARTFNRYARQLADQGFGLLINPQWQKEVHKLFLEDTENFLINIPACDIKIISKDQQQLHFSASETQIAIQTIKNHCLAPLTPNQKNDLELIWQYSFELLQKTKVPEEIKKIFEQTYQEFLQN